MIGKVALTFDDGPDAHWTPAVIDALARVDVRATFFVVAPLAARYPDIVRRARDEGHEVAFHCTEHVRQDRLTRQEIEADLTTGLKTLDSLGVRTRYWRVPWGLVTPATEAVARSRNLRVVGWTLDTKDWRGDVVSEMLDRVGPRLEPGAVVLMHDALGPGARRSGCAETVALLESLVSEIRQRGLEPAPVGELGCCLPTGNPEPVGGGLAGRSSRARDRL